MYERSQSEYEIKITSSVFYEKLGKHVETREILQSLRFEGIPAQNPTIY